MTSILTNSGARTALAMLGLTERQLGVTQAHVATGRSVGTARDNAAVWAISKGMTAEVAGFKAVSDSLGLAQATLSVGRQAAETVTDLLTTMKEKIVAAQEENVDREKIQSDIKALRDQIAAVTQAAQFNGLNVIRNDYAGYDGSATSNFDAGVTAARAAGEVRFLAGLDGTGSPDWIGFDIPDLGMNLGTKGQPLTTQAPTMEFDATDAAGNAIRRYVMLDYPVGPGRPEPVVATDVRWFEMSRFNTALGATVFTPGADDAVYTARRGDTIADLARGLVERINFQLLRKGVTTGTEGFEVFVDSGNTDAFIIRNNAGAPVSVGVTNDVRDYSLGRPSGGLDLVKRFDVTTTDGAKAALYGIDFMLDTAIDAAARIGSVQRRVETQQGFIAGLTDALRLGIGTLVDADMEEASARLQALQVQQQLGLTALSIANQSPQQVLALFR